MRKHVIEKTAQDTAQPEGPAWLDLESLLADVEITSEDAAHPIESALVSDDCSGWRAATPGKQEIRLLFAEPHQLRRIQLRFDESEIARTQEYVLRWSPDAGRSFQEIVRQQWNFSPEGSTSELNDLRVDLADVTALELTIVPDISGRPAIATLARLRLA